MSAKFPLRRSNRYPMYSIDLLEPRFMLIGGGEIFETNAISGTIGEYTATGMTVNASLVSGLSTPEDIAVSGSVLFVVNAGTGNNNGTIGEYTTSGAPINAALVSGLDQPVCIAVSGSDLFVTIDGATNTVGEYTTSGVSVNPDLISGLSIPAGIAVSGSDLFVGSVAADLLDGIGGRVGEYTTSGTTVNASLISGLLVPAAIAASGSDLFVASGSFNNPNCTIGEYTTSGMAVNATLVSGLDNLQSIAVSGSDLFATLAGTSNTIGEYTTSGATLNAALVSGLDVPGGIAIADAATNQLAFAGVPISNMTTGMLEPITVDIEDSSGAILTTDDSDITLAVSGGASGATLDGTTTVVAVNGVATFNDLYVTAHGDNYTLIAADSTETASSATSMSFDVDTYGLITIAAFDGANGQTPMSPTLDSSGNLFGTTGFGGDTTNNPDGAGTLFEIPQGTTSIVALPGFASMVCLTVDSTGDLFGIDGSDTVFEIVRGATSETDLASFQSNFENPDFGGLALDSSGDLFGTASDGSYGMVFELAKGATSITTLASFNGANGEDPEAGVRLDSSGDLFGTTTGGGDYMTLDNGLGGGAIFEVVQGATSITAVASFNGANGENPGFGDLAIDSSGDLFGTTTQGGSNGEGTAFEVAQGASSITVLANFNSNVGGNGNGALALDSSGNLFGTTEGGGFNVKGTVFEIAQGASSILTLAALTGPPQFALALDSSGNIYGTTTGGLNDASYYGSVFELTRGSTNPSTNKLYFAQQPASATTAGALAPIEVDVENSSGIVDTSDDSSITLAITGGSSGATLSGTTTEATVNGVATFSSLSISTIGDNYTLTATDPTALSATSTSFNVVSGPPPSPLLPALGRVSLPAAVVAGAKFTAMVPVVTTNQGVAFKGEVVTVNIYADTGTSLDGNQVFVTSMHRKVSLKTGKGQALNFNIRSLPSTLPDGVYHLLAEVVDSSGLTNVVATTQTITVAAAFIKPTVSVGAVIPSAIAAGKYGSVLVTVTNIGNIAADSGEITLSPSADGVTPVGVILDSVPNTGKILPGKSKTFRLRFKVTSALMAGNYYPYISVSLGGVVTTAVGPTQFAVA